MPKIVFTNPGVKDSVTRPVVLDIVRQVLEWTGLPKETPIQFPGELERVYQPGSTISTEVEFNRFEPNRRWNISVEEEHQMDRVLSTAVLYDDNPHTFWDGDTQVYMRPVYAPTDVTITIANVSKDKNEAIRWRDDIAARVSMGRDVKVHNANYSYLIPEEFFPIFKEIHRLRENVAGYGESFETYFHRYLSKKARILTDLIGKNQAWGVGETQARIIGYFDFDAAPEQGDRGEAAEWRISFTYRFKYDKPVASLLKYPLMVHNQLISKDFRPTRLPERIEDYQLNYSMSSRALATFESYRPSENNGIPGIAIPEFDEFLPAAGSVAPDTLRVLTALTSVDLTNPRDLLSLYELGEVSLDPQILSYMRGEAPYLTQLGRSFMHVNVYKDTTLMARQHYEVSDTLMVRLKVDPDLRATYHVRVSLYERPILLPSDAKERLRNHCGAAQLMMLALRPTLRDEGLLRQCMAGNYMPRNDLNAALELIDTRKDTKFNGEIYQFNTVLVLYAQTGKSS